MNRKSKDPAAISAGLPKAPAHLHQIVRYSKSTNSFKGTFPGPRRIWEISLVSPQHLRFPPGNPHILIWENPWVSMGFFQETPTFFDFFWSGPHHEHLLAIFDHRLHSVSPDTVQGESWLAATWRQRWTMASPQKRSCSELINEIYKDFLGFLFL